MLEQLSIKNLVVVEDLSAEFQDGMTVITGETGAGKSIIVQALNLVSGGRSDATLVRHGKDKAEIVAMFQLGNNSNLLSFLENCDLEDGEECILRRVIGSDGRSRAYVNGSSVSLSKLREVGTKLIDMHGQNEHQLLLKNNQHRILLDDFAESQGLCEEINNIVHDYLKVKNKIVQLQNTNEQSLAQKELLTYQLNELVESKLEQDELDSIEKNFKISNNASVLIEKIADILESLEHESGANELLIRAESITSKASELDSDLESVSSILSSAQVQVQEGIYDLRDYLGKVSDGKVNIAELEKRISHLHSLGRKHNCQIPELLKVQNNIQSALAELDSSSDKIEELTNKLRQLELNYKKESTVLTKYRQQSSKTLSKKVTDVMQDLGMPGSEVLFSLNATDEPIRLNGQEEVVINVKTNIGQDLKPLNKVASGGELSRVSLALSVVTSKSELAPSIVFDEVDVGISGSVAEVVGRLLKKLSSRYQVLCVTHLAQVAAQGHEHMKVIKSQRKNATYTQMTSLNKEQRTDEVARILGGIKVSDKARLAAEEMIKARA
jgi:DNA repair protein RecN (Recombination protein N)